MMKTWVVTGGVACGKSAVSKALHEGGGGEVALFSSDQAVHRLLEETTTRGKLVREFGLETLGADGSVDRAWLRARMLTEPPLRKRLEAILHPGVFAAFKAFSDELVQAGKTKVLVAEVPLFYEVGSLPAADQVIVVASSQDTQIERLRLHRGLAQAEAVALIESQLAIMEKVNLSNRVIWNDGGIDALEDQVRLIINDLWIQ